jgi:hypothetical protein
MASGDLVIHKYVAEVTLGVTPTTPALTKMNVVSSSIDAQISTTVSNQISATGDEADIIQTEGSTSGDIAIEWQYAAYDDFIASAVRNTWSTAVSVTGTDISAAATDNSINSVGAAFSTTNILPGHWVVAEGFTGGNIANNGVPMRVVSVTTSKIVVSGVTLVDDAAGESITVKGKSIRNGTTRKSFTIEKEFPDLATTFVSHKGMVANTMNISAAVGSIVTGSFGFNGMTTTYAATTVGTGTEIAAVSNEVFSPVSSIGTIYENGTALAGTCIRSINLTTTSNTRNNQCLGSMYPSAINLGTINVSGTLEIYFNSTTLLDKFINATATSLAFWFDDAAGNHFVVDMPQVKFTTGSVSGISKNSDCMVSLGFTAVRDSVEGFTIQISSIAT